MNFGLSQVKSHKQFGMAHDALFNRKNRGLAQKLIDAIPVGEDNAMSIVELASKADITYKNAKGAILFAIKNVPNLMQKPVNGKKVFWIEE